jgi:hypothetical protein
MRSRLIPRERRVILLTLCLKFCRDFGAIRIFLGSPAQKLKPKKARFWGSATVLFSRLILSLRCFARNRPTESITRCPARSDRT